MEALKKYFYGDTQTILVFKYDGEKEFPDKNIEKNRPRTTNDGSEFVNFKNGEFHFLLKFFFICSKFRPINDNERAIYFNSALDKAIKCECGELLHEKFFLNGRFETAPPVKPSIHEYYLRISEKCEKCNETIWIYRYIGVAPYFFKKFFPSLDFDGENHYSEEDILLEWSNIVCLWLKICSDEEFSYFHKNIIKFDELLISKFALP